MTIVNVPSAEKLNDFALVLYFDAWERLHDIYEAFYLTYPDGISSWTDEWKDYVEVSSRDFETIINLVAQSAEISMKSKLCAVSPFLLLLGQGASFKKVDGELDFSDLRTIDSVDLPGAVNTFCPEKLTDSFIQDFNKLRRLRNKSVHLGATSESIDPVFVVDALVNFFDYLWGDGNFLVEWVRIASRGRYSFFHDGENGNAHATVFENFDLISEIITKGQFKRLTGISKSTRRYFCFDCISEGRTDYEDWLSRDNTRTAYLVKGTNQIECFMCRKRFDIVREKCGKNNCPGDVVSSPEIECDYHCHTCGRDRD